MVLDLEHIPMAWTSAWNTLGDALCPLRPIDWGPAQIHQCHTGLGSIYEPRMNDNLFMYVQKRNTVQINAEILDYCVKINDYIAIYFSRHNKVFIFTNITRLNARWTDRGSEDKAHALTKMGRSRRWSVPCVSPTIPSRWACCTRRSWMETTPTAHSLARGDPDDATWNFCETSRLTFVLDPRFVYIPP